MVAHPEFCAIGSLRLNTHGSKRSQFEALLSNILQQDVLSVQKKHPKQASKTSSEHPNQAATTSIQIKLRQSKLMHMARTHSNALLKNSELSVAHIFESRNKNA